MVKQVTITNHIGDKVSYKIEGVDVYNNNGLLITEIEGLGPTGADIVFTKLVGANGAVYNSGRLNQRNIVIHALFTWAKTIEQARLSSYRMFPIGKKLRFDIETENRQAYVYGYVEKNEPNIFSSQSEVMISVMCESALLNDVREYSEYSISNIEPMFEFVYENEGHEPVTIMGEYIPGQIHEIYNESDDEVGFRMTIAASGPVVNPAIIYIDTGDTFIFDTNKILQHTGITFGAGDELLYISEANDKSYWLIHNGSAYPLTTLLDKNAKWPKLHPGWNRFLFRAESGDDYLTIYFRYHELYDGV